MPDVINEEAPDRVERRSIVIDASPTTIFDLLADPSQHHQFDGSGTVGESADSTPERLQQGAKFGMKMTRVVPYRITNEVVEFVDDERIAWRHMGGHIWRYTLESVDGGTKVTEEFDWRPSRLPLLLKAIKAPADNANAIEKTLRRLSDAVAP